MEEFEIVRDPFAQGAKPTNFEGFPGVIGPVVHNVVLKGKLVVRGSDGVEIKRAFTTKEMNRMAALCNGRRNEKFPGYMMVTLMEPTPVTCMIFVTGKVVMAGAQKISHIHLCASSLASYLLKNMQPEWVEAHVVEVEVTNLMGVLYMGHELDIPRIHQDVSDSTYHPDNICSIQIERLLKRKQPAAAQPGEGEPSVAPRGLPKRRRTNSSKAAKEKDKTFKRSAAIYHTGNCVLTGTNSLEHMLSFAADVARFLSSYRKLDKPVPIHTDEGTMSTVQWIGLHEKEMCKEIDSL